MTDVSDDELDALTRRIRALRRKQRFAKLAGVAIAFVGLIVGFAASALLRSTPLASESGRVFWLIAIVFLVAGGFVYRKLDPNEQISDIE